MLLRRGSRASAGALCEGRIAALTPEQATGDTNIGAGLAVCIPCAVR